MMEEHNTVDMAAVFKALGDPTRLKIMEMLSCGELCACDILEFFNISQPTLSYHMKILTDCELVKSRKKGSWTYYSNNNELMDDILRFWHRIAIEQEDCICKEIKGGKL